MKIVGLMAIKDEADLIPEVLPHISERVDDILIYDDGSQDNTWDMSYAKFREIHQAGIIPKYLERAKKWA